MQTRNSPQGGTSVDTRCGFHRAQAGQVEAAPRRLRGRGVTLVEVLVTIVLVGVGLLGLAGLQARGIQVNEGAAFRAQAANLAADLVDRLRTDPAGTAAASYDGTYVGGAAGKASAPTPAAQALLQDWLAQLGAMPGASATVATVAPVLTITVNWDDARANSAAAGPGAARGASTGSFVLVTELTD